jgi:hypothetical protein
MQTNLIIAALATAALSATAYAGMRWSQPVGIIDNRAYGSLADTRASADGNNIIGCLTYGSRLYTGTGMVFCWAISGEQQLTCIETGNQSLVDATQAIGSATYVSFVADKQGYCTDIEAQNFSAVAPMEP